ncbi:MAG: hypothetical protein M3552_03320 [Planctomycetota bacterium]|nr:hypothetical protein [Planctomycetota bacterium]
MKSVTTAGFREELARLPAAVRRQAARAYDLWRAEPFHPSLQFKRISQRQQVYSVRVGLSYRALGLWEGDEIQWFWIGPHSEYDGLVERL